MLIRDRPPLLGKEGTVGIEREKENPKRLKWRVYEKKGRA